MNQKLYRGIRAPVDPGYPDALRALTVVVQLGGTARHAFHQALNPRFDLRNHSPTGFECGYGGSGPAQLALALLADCLGNERQAEHLYQEFKEDLICTLPRDRDWILTEDLIRRWARGAWSERQARSRQRGATGESEERRKEAADAPGHHP